MENNALYHWGIKGQKWGQRRYQNKDGSLTPAGQKRYNKEVEKLKKETAKVKAAEKLAANNKKVQSKFDKLEEKKAALEARKKALKDGKDPEEEKKKAEEVERETVEQKRERLLKSTNPKELYENRELLSTMELNERINRIDTEARLNSKIVADKELTGMEKMREMQTKLDTLTNTYRSIDNAYSTVMKSAIGKTLAKKLGLEPPKEEFDINKLWAKRNKLSNKEIQEINQRLNNEKNIELELDRRKNKAEKEAKNDNNGNSKKDAKKAEKEAKKTENKAEKEAKEAEKKAAEEAKEAEKNKAKAQREVDDYNDRWQRGDSDDNVSTKSYDPDGSYSRTNTDASGRRRGDDNYRDSTSKLGIEQKPTRVSDDDVEIIEPEWYTRFKTNGSNNTTSSVNASTRVSDVPAVVENSGRSFVERSGNTTAPRTGSRGPRTRNFTQAEYEALLREWDEFYNGSR